MPDAEGRLICNHANVSDLITAPLNPGDEQLWHPSMVGIDPASKLESAIKQNLTTTGPGLDNIEYLVIRCSWKEKPHCFRPLLEHGLTKNIPD